MMSDTFEKSIVIVTGGGSGIGRAICQLMALRKCTVVCADIDFKSAEDTILLLKGSEAQHKALSMDVRKMESVKNAFEQIIKEYSKPPNLLVNCAGVSLVKSIENTTEEDYYYITDTCFKGPFLVTKEFIEHYKKASLKSGSIVNIGSIASKVGTEWLSIYAASKAALDTYTKCTARETADLGIRVNCIRPGLVRTNMLPPENQIVKEKIEQIKKNTLLKREAEPEEIAEQVAHLLSERSSFVTGTILDITGGLHI